MYINRHIENVIKRESEAFPAVLVTGSRQIGKSTTLKHIYPDMKYINLDDRIALLSMHEDHISFKAVSSEYQ